MSPELVQLIQAGNDIVATKYYALATGMILFYDYLLTLGDEIKYFWSGKRSWTFWLFLVNRYFPMAYQFWKLVVIYLPQSQSTTRAYESHFTDARCTTLLTFSWNRCDKSVWLPFFTYTICALVAQVAMTARVYAVTSRNVPVLIGFAIVNVSQLALGISLTILTARDGAQMPQLVPLDAYHTCIFVRHRTLEIACTGVSLFYDFSAFSVVIFWIVTSSWSPGLTLPRMLKTVATDSTWYFLVLFSTQSVFELTLTLGRASIQLLPASGVVVYLPVMISRMMLSLRKAADPQQWDWTFAELSANERIFQTINFSDPRTAASSRDDILDIPIDAYC